MTKKRVYAIKIAAIALFLLAPIIYSQANTEHIVKEALPAKDSPPVIKDKGFPGKERPPSIFFHDKHYIEAGLEGRCYVCHHADGKNPDPAYMSIGNPCSDCHKADTVKQDRPSLTRAYHDLCKGCHLEEGAGPIACGECHVR